MARIKRFNIRNFFVNFIMIAYFHYYKGQFGGNSDTITKSSKHLKAASACLFFVFCFYEEHYTYRPSESLAPYVPTLKPVGVPVLPSFGVRFAF